MANEERERAEEERKYFQRVGYMAKTFGLPPETKDHEILEHERKLRAEARNLTAEANWFQVYCAEFKAGLKPTVPDYCELTGVDTEERPEQAFLLAEAAAQIFMVKE